MTERLTLELADGTLASADAAELADGLEAVVTALSADDDDAADGDALAEALDSLEARRESDDGGPTDDGRTTLEGVRWDTALLVD